jgi:hypothetical protein
MIRRLPFFFLWGGGWFIDWVAGWGMGYAAQRPNFMFFVV